MRTSPQFSGRAMNSVVFLGIDGLDADYIDEHLDELPTLRRLREDGMLIALPLDLPTGLHSRVDHDLHGEAPDTHGVVESIDYLAKNPAKATERAPTSSVAAHSGMRLPSVDAASA